MMTVVIHASTIEMTKLIDGTVRSLRPEERIVATVPEGPVRVPEIYLVCSREADTLVPLTKFREELLEALPPFKGGVARVLVAAERTM